MEHNATSAGSQCQANINYGVARLADQLPKGRLKESGRLDFNGSSNDGRNNLDRSPDDKRPVDFKVELLCRTFVGDDDLRPLVPGSIFWESPDIWIEGPSGPDKPVAGVINRVNVHVWNLGLMDSPATFVDLYVCNPSVGVNLAASQPIGSNFLTLGAGEHRVVSFDWTPTFLNGGHECLVAQVYDPLNDPVVSPFNPMQDRHVAQRNVSVIETSAGKTTVLHFSVPNISQRLANCTITLEPVIADDLQALAMATGRDRFLSQSGAEAGLTNPTFRPVRIRKGGVDLRAPRTFREVLSPGSAQNIAIAMMATRGGVIKTDIEEPMETEELPAASGGLAARHALSLRPGHEALIGLHVQAPIRSRPGTSHAFRVVERVAGVVTGGVTMIVEDVLKTAME